MEKLHIYVDGSGDGYYCYFIEETGTAKLFKKENISHNQAEYLAVCEALLAASRSWAREIVILSDSQLAVKQLSHEWNISSAALRDLAASCWQLIGSMNKRVTFKWISRKENKAGKFLGKPKYAKKEKAKTEKD